jgi:hypothetical protein
MIVRDSAARHVRISEGLKISEILGAAESGTVPDGIALSLGSIPRKFLSKETLAHDYE